MVFNNIYFMCLTGMCWSTNSKHVNEEFDCEVISCVMRSFGVLFQETYFSL